MYEHLLTPGQIGSMTLKNRLIVPAMSTRFVGEDGMATPAFIAYHEARAQGGWALLITENFCIAPLVGVKKELPGLWSEAHVESYRPFTQRIHQAGGKVVAQIYHAGRNTHSGITGQHNVGPSPICDPSNREIPHELTQSEIATIVQQFAQAARRAKDAGFDGVELHGAHGYLIAQFLSPFSNKRSDRYGGSIVNCARFAVEIIQATRQAVGADFPIFFRISATEFISEGMNLPRAQALCPLLEAAGADVINVSQSGPATFYNTVPSYYVPNGSFVHLAAAIKQVVSIPVITVGRINSPDMAESILRAGQADFVAMGRSSVADPNLPRKLMAGTPQDILPCIGCCQGCLGNTIRKQSLGCLVNPMAGQETCFTPTPTETPAYIVVVGGGISGCTVAIHARARGHRVTLLESTHKLGGQWNLAATPPFKSEFASLVAWQTHRLAQLGVDVRTNTPAQTADWAELSPDVVIDASGSAPIIPPIPGLDHCNWTVAQDILAGKVPLGRRPLIIGGGLVGAETAEFMAAQKSLPHLVELQDTIASEAEPGPRYFLLKSLGELGVHLHPATRVLSLAPEQAVVEHQGAETTLSDIDQVVLAVGVRSATTVGEFLQTLPYPIHSIGDAHSPKNGLANIREALELALSL